MNSPTIDRTKNLLQDCSPEKLAEIIRTNLKKLWDKSEKGSEADEWTENIFAAFTLLQEKSNPYKESPAIHLGRFLNIMGQGDNRAVFLRDMRQMHPTLQQSLAGHLFAWMNEYALEYTVDGRNQSSITEVRKILEAYKEATGNDQLPTRFMMI